MNNSTQPAALTSIAIRGTAWRYSAFFVGKLMVFISTVILARLLTKDDFGVVGYAVTAIAFLDIVSDFGVGEALIYYPEGKKTYTTAFWISLTIGILLFGLTWVAAPLLATYFRDARVTDVTRALAFTFPIRAFSSTHDSILRKELDFGRTVIPDLLKSLTKGLLSIALALFGFGAWSLIWGQIGGTLALSIAFWIIMPWKPSFTFDLKIARSLLRYGLTFIGTDFLAVLLSNLDYLLIGRYLGAVALGVYTLAYRLPDLLIMKFARTISGVIFPIYSQTRDVPGKMARGLFLATRYVALVVIPLGLGLALVARPFTLTFFTAKWEEAIPVLQGIAIYAMFLAFAHNTNSTYKAEGRLKMLTGLGITRLLVLIPALWWAVTSANSIVAVGWVQAAVAFLSATLMLVVAARLVNLPLSDLLAALRPAILSGAIMSVGVLLALNMVQTIPPWLQLTVTVSVGGTIYIAALWLFQRDVVLFMSKKLRTAMGRT